MSRIVELRRHTDNDGDALTREGIRTAVELGRSLDGGYRVAVSSGAQRATQTAACLIAGLGQRVPGGVAVETGLRSDREDDWRAAYQRAGSGDLESFRSADPDLVESESSVLAAGLKSVFDRLDQGERALAVGHSPTNEAAVLGLTGAIIDPMGKGDGVTIIEEDGVFRIAEAG